MAVNKVVYNTANGPETLIDLTGDTVTSETLAKGVTAHDASGNAIIGMASTEHTHTTITESNQGRELGFWVGTQAEYDALAEPPQDTYVIISDDHTLENIMEEIETLKANSGGDTSGNASTSECGSYTPKLTSNGVELSSIDSTVSGYYCKTGKLVNFWVNFEYTTPDSGQTLTDAGVSLPVVYTGAPAIITSIVTVQVCEPSGVTNPITDNDVHTAVIEVGGTSADFRSIDGNSVTWNTNSSGIIRVSGTYLVE